MTRVFLTRHFLTESNLWEILSLKYGSMKAGEKPADNNTPSKFGRGQPTVLSQYLRLQGFDFEKSLLVTSNIERTVVTARETYKHSGIENVLNERNKILSLKDLNECRYFQAGSKGSEIEGRLTYNLITKIAEENKDRDILFVLHGNRNRLLLDYVGIYIKFFSNCSLVEFRYNEGELSLSKPYTMFKDMKEQVDMVKGQIQKLK